MLKTIQYFKTSGFKANCLILMLMATSFANAQTTTLTFQHGGLTRTAQVYVPPAAQPSDSLPLVLVLQGKGDFMKGNYVHTYGAQRCFAYSSTASFMNIIWT
ncbi:MAG: hypothetical protein ACKO7V_10685 [Bacteroidota bacterium]